jgi:glycosyltransferase involved in cell wall biosynthesis
MNEPLLSICLITYNHQKYIRDAIEGVLAQKANFSWKLIIADDCSTDGTRGILVEYKKQYPELIDLILQEKNVGPAKNWMGLISYPKSKYIAYFEGDDYWTDPLKIQKQVDLLESNQDVSMCFHNALIKYDDDPTRDRLFCQNFKNLQLFTIKDVIATNWFCPSASILFRNDKFPEFPEWTPSIYNGDLLMHLLLSSNGNIVYLDETMCVYRQDVAGSLTARKRKLTTYNNHIIDLLVRFNKFSGYKYKDDINRRIVQLRIKNLKTIVLHILSKFNYERKLKGAATNA